MKGISLFNKAKHCRFARMRFARPCSRCYIYSSFMRRFLAIILVLLSPSLLAEDVLLSENQSIVVAKVDSHSFKFEEISTGSSFWIKGGKKYRYKTKKVTAGKYFLSRIDLINSNVKDIEFDKPENQNHVFHITPGNLIYLGEWKIDLNQNRAGQMNWEIERDYPISFLKRVSKKNKELINFNLIIANEEGKILPLLWEKI